MKSRKKESLDLEVTPTVKLTALLWTTCFSNWAALTWETTERKMKLSSSNSQLRKNQRAHFDDVELSFKFSLMEFN